MVSGKKCNTKLFRIINASLASLSEKIRNIIIVADAEGRDIDLSIKQIEIHVPETAKKRVHYIIFDYCIEEWICTGLGIKIRENPIEELKTYLRQKKRLRYEKYMLTEFVDEINLSLLMNNKKFREFISWLSI
ncbi:MAG: hypothetical protein Q6363_010740 [Candidatus Njordarchaeota archaeon]